jgi:hypothetical protein
MSYGSKNYSLLEQFVSSVGGWLNLKMLILVKEPSLRNEFFNLNPEFNGNVNEREI